MIGVGSGTYSDPRPERAARYNIYTVEKPPDRRVCLAQRAARVFAQHRRVCLLAVGIERHVDRLAAQRASKRVGHRPRVEVLPVGARHKGPLLRAELHSTACTSGGRGRRLAGGPGARSSSRKRGTACRRRVPARRHRSRGTQRPWPASAVQPAPRAGSGPASLRAPPSLTAPRYARLVASSPRAACAASAAAGRSYDPRRRAADRVQLGLAAGAGSRTADRAACARPGCGFRPR